MSIIFVGPGNFLGVALVGNYAFFWAHSKLNVTAGLRAIKWFCLNIIDACRESFQGELQIRDY